MEIESDAEGCECHRNINSTVRFFRGWRGSEGTYLPTFFNAYTFWKKAPRIILGILWFLAAEGGLLWAFLATEGDSWKWAYFAGMSTMVILFATVAAFLSMNYIDVACHIFIGKTRYVFMDESGKLHVHREEPHKQWLPVLQVRSGGIFRKCRVIRTCDNTWSVSVGLFDDFIVVTDREGTSIAVKDIGYQDMNLGVTRAARLKKTIRYVAEVYRLDDVLTLHEQEKQELKDFDTLGIECTELIHLMEASKQTMGRSKHAQLLRERLQAVFKKMPNNRIQSWEYKVAKAVAKPEPAAKAG